MRLGKISDQIERAVKIMKTRGWRRGGAELDDNPDTCTVCAFSALAVAQGKNHNYWYIAKDSPAGKFLYSQMGISTMWNDMQYEGRSVIEALEAAAHLAREMGK